MDFDLDDDQGALQAALETLLSRHAGPGRAREIAHQGAYDQELEAALEEGGFLGLFSEPDGGPLTAALAVMAVARAAGVIAMGARTLVAAALTDDVLRGPIALAVEGSGAPVRFGSHARTVLVAGRDEARVRTLTPVDAEPVSSRYGYPFARVPTDGGDSFGEGSAHTMRRWWRVAIAVETAGTMLASLGLTVDYLKERRQFGRPIGSFQAVQHRLAEAAVSVEGARWLSLEAAWLGAPEEEAAAAAHCATSTAKQLAPELHQLTGAIGLTVEYDLHLWTMRLPALRLELDGVGGHARALAVARWS